MIIHTSFFSVCGFILKLNVCYVIVADFESISFFIDPSTIILMLQGFMLLCYQE